MCIRDRHGVIVTMATKLPAPRRLSMTKAEIVEDIASKTGLTKKDVATAMDMFLESISKALADGKHYEIRGFGTFKVKKRKSRMARNPRTGDAVPVPAVSYTHLTL